MRIELMLKILERSDRSALSNARNVSSNDSINKSLLSKVLCPSLCSLSSTLNDLIISIISGSVRNYLTTRADVQNPPDLNISIPIDIGPNTQVESNLVGVNYVLGETSDLALSQIKVSNIYHVISYDSIFDVILALSLI